MNTVNIIAIKTDTENVEVFIDGGNYNTFVYPDIYIKVYGITNLLINVLPANEKYLNAALHILEMQHLSIKPEIRTLRWLKEYCMERALEGDD